MKVVVVGGGLAGLVSAHELVSKGIEVSLLEASPSLGGQIQTLCTNGFTVELGAEAYVVASQEVRRLAQKIELTDRVVSQLVPGSLGLVNRRLKALEAGRAAAAVGIQASRSQLGQGVQTFAAGMGELIDRLCDRLADRAKIKTGCRVSEMRPAQSRWVVETEEGEELQADFVIAAIPPAAAVRILPEPLAARARALASMPVVSSVTVSLAYPRSAIGHSLDAAGMVAIPGDRKKPGFKACTFSSSKFPNRAPPDWVLLRAFFRPGRRYPIAAADQVWIDRAARALKKVLEIRSDPEHAWVSRWPDALPDAHPDRIHQVRRLDTALRKLGNIQVAGSAYHGAGVPGAIASGERAAGAPLIDSRL